MSFLVHDAFVEGMSRVIETAASPELEAFTFFRLGPSDLPWQPLGLEASQGQKVTFLVGGRLWLSREHDLWIEPGCALHVRSADKKPMYNPMLNNGTMTAAHDGAVTIARSMAEWENEDGELWTPVDAYTQADVDIFGVALKWRGNAEAGMESLLAGGDVAGAIARELGRLRTSQPLPDGWHNHFNAGGDDVIFRSGGQGQIVCQSHKTGGLLRHPAELPLVPGTRLSWRWVIEELPSLHPENSLVTHDYLSVGVEFDDGQDLTYIWSHSLPEGEVFRCPIPRWNPIETHMIIRSGFEGMGEWMAEETRRLRRLSGPYRRRRTEYHPCLATRGDDFPETHRRLPLWRHQTPRAKPRAGHPLTVVADAKPNSA